MFYEEKITVEMTVISYGNNETDWYIKRAPIHRTSFTLHGFVITLLTQPWKKEKNGGPGIYKNNWLNCITYIKNINVFVGRTSAFFCHREAIINWQFLGLNTTLIQRSRSLVHSFFCFTRIYFTTISRLKFAKFWEYFKIKPEAEILESI